MKISVQTSQKISLLSFVATVFVVIQHFGLKVAPSGWPNCIYRYGISHGIADFPVSFFFMVSGFFVVKHYTSFSFKWWRGEIYKRMFSLLVPYIVWCSLQWAIRAAYENSSGGGGGIMGFWTQLPSAGSGANVVCQKFASFLFGVACLCWTCQIAFTIADMVFGRRFFTCACHSLSSKKVFCHE